MDCFNTPPQPLDIVGINHSHPVRLFYYWFNAAVVLPERLFGSIVKSRQLSCASCAPCIHTLCIQSCTKPATRTHRDTPQYGRLLHFAATVQFDIMITIKHQMKYTRLIYGSIRRTINVAKTPSPGASVPINECIVFDVLEQLLSTSVIIPLQLTITPPHYIGYVFVKGTSLKWQELN